MPIGILQLVHSLEPGGTERIVVEMSKRLHLVHGFRIGVCCLDEAGAWSQQLQDLGIPVLPLYRKPGFRPSLAAQIAAVAAKQHARLVHCHQFTPFVYGRLAAWCRPHLIPIFTEHGRLSDAAPTWKRLIANAIFGRLSGTMYAVSEDLRNRMAAEGFPARRIRIIPNGIDLGELPRLADRLRARQSLALSPDDLVVGTIARLDPVKDIKTLVAALALIVGEFPALSLVLVGEGPERARLESCVESVGLHGRVVFTGVRHEARDLLPAFDVFANCSTSEGISLTILEAMAAGLPVVATKVGGTPEVVVHNETGLLVEPRAPEALAAALRSMLRGPDLSEQLGRAGRQRVERLFTIDRMVDEYRRVYLRALERERQ